LVTRGRCGPPTGSCPRCADEVLLLADPGQGESPTGEEGDMAGEPCGAEAQDGSGSLSARRALRESGPEERGRCYESRLSECLDVRHRYVPSMTGVAAVIKRSARAILLTDDGELLLIKRTKPGQQPYWTAPGGGVEDSDASVEAALHRELVEELGARVAGASQVFLVSTPAEGGVSVQHIFAARLSEIDEQARSGEEYSDLSRGGYELDRVDLRSDALSAVDLKPAALKEFILANREALLVEVAPAA
jgi:ADP-ribose pyrophosphatase YjhB (NUDIX family)